MNLLQVLKANILQLIEGMPRSNRPLWMFPILILLNLALYSVRFARIGMTFRGASLAGNTLRWKGAVFRSNDLYMATLLNEWNKWEREYVPYSFALKGKTVLDVGAGCGETAFFFLDHGASKVICVEPDIEAFALLEKNVEANGWNAELHNARFAIGMLGWNYDYMKMDCEGCEVSLLSQERLPPSSIEVHDTRTLEAIRKRFRSTVIGNHNRTWIVRTR